MCLATHRCAAVGPHTQVEPDFLFLISIRCDILDSEFRIGDGVLRSSPLVSQYSESGRTNVADANAEVLHLRVHRELCDVRREINSREFRTREYFCGTP